MTLPLARGSKIGVIVITVTFPYLAFSFKNNQDRYLPGIRALPVESISLLTSLEVIIANFQKKTKQNPCPLPRLFWIQTV